MITTFLIAYVVLTLPFVGLIAYRVYKPLQPKEAEGMSVPAMIAESRVRVLDEIRLIQRTATAWFPTIDLSIKDLKKDSVVMMQSLSAIALAMGDIRKSAETFNSSVKKDISINRFIQQLEYARDKYAITTTQKRAVQRIISNVLTQHGTEIK